MSNEHRLLGQTFSGRLARIVLVGFFTLLASCVNYADRGDHSFAIGDWEAAVTDYEVALGDADDPAEIQRLKERLADARSRAGAARLKKAREHLGIGETQVALEHAERAFRFTPTPECQQLLKELRDREASRHLAEGERAMGHGDWDGAVASLAKAQSLAPTEIGAELLRTAKAESEKFHAAQFAELSSRGREALDARNWSQAVETYRRAHQHGRTEASQAEAGFARIMSDAEALYLLKPTEPARVQLLLSKYEAALRHGMDTEFVSQRIVDVRPTQYRVTIKSAIILPFRPSSLEPWDGTGGNKVAAGLLLSGLGSFVRDGEIQTARLGASIISLREVGFEAPDCFPLVRIGKVEHGGPLRTDPDEFLPSWEFSVPTGPSNVFDERKLSVEVRDRDGLGHDTVGAVEIRLRDLLLAKGAMTIPLFDEKGQLHNGGLLAITLAAERVHGAAAAPGHGR